MRSFFAGALIAGLLVMGGAIFAIGGTSWISVGQVGIVKHMDGTVTEIPQGIHWTGWGVSVQEYPTFMQSLVLNEKQAWVVGTADQQELTVETNLTWSINLKDALAVYQSVGGKDIDYIKDNIVKPTMKNIVNAVTHKYGWNAIKGADQAKVAAEVNEQLEKELAKVGIVKGNFGFAHVGAPAGMEEAQKSLASSELATKQAQQAQEKAKIENQTKLMNAETDAKVAEVQAEGVKAKANAIPNDLLIRREAVEKWDGKLPQTMSGEAVPFLSIGKSK